jgi:hypothetical protein
MSLYDDLRRMRETRFAAKGEPPAKCLICGTYHPRQPCPGMAETIAEEKKQRSSGVTTNPAARLPSVTSAAKPVTPVL